MQYNSYVNRQWVMLYLIYSMRIIITMMFLLLSSSWIWFFQASSHCFNHRRPVYTETGFTAADELVFARSPASYQSTQKPHISRTLPFSGKEGRIRWMFPVLTSHASSFISAEIGKVSLIVNVVLRQNESAGSRPHKHLDGIYKSLSWR